MRTAAAPPSVRPGRARGALRPWFLHRKEAPVAYTGQSLKRLEDRRLRTGQGAFLDDLTFPDMLSAAVLRSPHAHASIRASDTAAARHAPGVVAVHTAAADLEGVVEPLPTRRETEAQELRPPVHPLLARGKVCYTGQPVAVVVAQERYLVRDALTLIQVDYAPLPAVIDPLDALQAAAVHPELGTNIGLRAPHARGHPETHSSHSRDTVPQHTTVA